MRRDYFTVEVQSDPDDDVMPTISIDYDGPSGSLRERLTTADGSILDGDELDVTFRRQTDEEQGVLSLTNRLTGDFVLEATVDPREVLDLVDAAQSRPGESRFELRLTDGEGKSLVYEKGTLLVYAHDGNLKRQESLIPGGVEL